MKQYLIKFNDGTEDKIESADEYRKFEDHWFTTYEFDMVRVYYGKFVESVTLLGE